jgi:hypothetical protein
MRAKEETEGSREDRRLKRGHRGGQTAVEETGAMERTVGRGGTEGCRKGRGP